jgi:hypothetical protein
MRNEEFNPINRQSPGRRNLQRLRLGDGQKSQKPSPRPHATITRSFCQTDFRERIVLAESLLPQ